MDVEKNALYETKLLTGAEARIISATVKAIVKEELPGVFDRELFTTLGAASYIDDWREYAENLKAGNQLLHNFFLPLIRQSIATVVRTMGIETTVSFLPSKALPGFHVFDSRGNGVIASVHTDEPYKEHGWPGIVTRVGSFTLPLELPACGGGLNIWQEGQNPAKTAPKFVPYEVGTVYMHCGTEPHQIANRGDIALGEYRITLQGHVVELDNGTSVFYF